MADGNGSGAGVGEAVALTKKDFSSDQEVRWCPGCGDYSVLTAVQLLMPELGVRPENTVFVSGIGCSSRFPYYMNTYGIHSIHGRAPAVATGVAIARPELDVWVITGDGDGLSIGGNHLIHALRRNVNFTILMFNNQIYGLTKGQYSPTSEMGKVTKSSPFGSLDYPFNPLSLALGAEATFVARTHDMDRKHMQSVFKRAHDHKGAAFVEIYQNCNVFNDGAFDAILKKDTRAEMLIELAPRRADPVRRRRGARGAPQRVRRGRGRERRRRRRSKHCWSTTSTDPTRRSRSHSHGWPTSRRSRRRSACSATSAARPTRRRSSSSSLAAQERSGPGDLRKLIESAPVWDVNLGSLRCVASIARRFTLPRRVSGDARCAHMSRRRKTAPVRGLGAKNVVFCGMRVRGVGRGADLGDGDRAQQHCRVRDALVDERRARHRVVAVGDVDARRERRRDRRLEAGRVARRSDRRRRDEQREAGGVGEAEATVGAHAGVERRGAVAGVRSRVDQSEVLRERSRGDRTVGGSPVQQPVDRLRRRAGRRRARRRGT